MKNLLPTLLLLCLSQALTAQSDKLIDSLSKTYSNISYYENTPFLEVTQKGKYGLSKPKTDALYDEILQLNENSPTVAAKKNGFWGLIDSTGKEIGRWDYDGIINIGNDYLFEKDRKEGIITQNGKEILSPIYDKINASNLGFQLKLNGKVGLADHAGNIIIPVEYTNIQDIDDGFNYYDFHKDEGDFYSNYLSLFKDSLLYIWDVKNAKIITEGLFTNIQYTPLGFIVQKKGKYGMIDTLGNVLISCENFGIRDFSNYNYLLISKRSQTQLVETKSQYSSNTEWGTNYSANMTTCDIKSIDVNVWGLYTANGKEILPPIYDYLEPISPDFFIAEINQMKGVIDTKGNLIVPFAFDKIEYNSFYIAASNENEASIYNYKGDKVIKNLVTCFTINSPGNEYIWLKDSTQNWYSLDSMGKINKYKIQDLSIYNENLTATIKGKKYFLSPNGKVKMDAVYNKQTNNGWSNLNVFESKHINKNERYNYKILNGEGKTILKLRNLDNSINLSSYQYVITTQNQKKAIFNTLTRKHITPFRYKLINYNHDTTFKCFDVEDFKGNRFTLDTLGKKIPTFKTKKENIHFEIITPQKKNGIIDTLGRCVIAPNYEYLNVYKDILVGKTYTDSMYMFNHLGQRIWHNYYFDHYRDGLLFVKDSLGKKAFLTQKVRLFSLSFTMMCKLKMGFTLPKKTNIGRFCQRINKHKHDLNMIELLI